MASLKSLTLLAAAAAALAAPAAADAGGTRGPERGLDSLNQPVVERTDYVLDLSAPSGALSSTERAKLRAWFNSLGLGYGDHVFVDEGYGPGPVTADIARISAEYGLLLSEGAPLTGGQVPNGAARVIVSRTTASVPNCPAADNRRGGSSISANYGCAINSNWAAMVADPRDLVLGQAGSVSTDATVGNKAIKVYRETPPTGTKGLQDGVTRGGH